MRVPREREKGGGGVESDKEKERREREMGGGGEVGEREGGERERVRHTHSRG